MNFKWDEHKNQSNLRKHRISFEEAKEIFNGPVLTRLDERFDYYEERYISLGSMNGIAILVVVHTERDDIIRIISARYASRRE